MSCAYERVGLSSYVLGKCFLKAVYYSGQHVIGSGRTIFTHEDERLWVSTYV